MPESNCHRRGTYRLAALGAILVIVIIRYALTSVTLNI